MTSSLLMVVVVCLALSHWSATVDAFVVVTTPHQQPRHHARLSSSPLVVLKPLWVSSSEAATVLSQVADDEVIAEESSSISSDSASVSASESESPSVASELGDEQEQQEDGKRVRRRDRNTLFVGNLSFDMSDTDIRDLFAQYGKVELVNLPRDRETGGPRGFAFVDMNTEEEAEAAVAALDKSTYGDRIIRVNKSIPKKEFAEGGNNNKRDRPIKVEAPGTKKIYVGNISFESTQEEITALYEQFGQILEVYVPVDRRTGMGRGFAFVTMKEEDVDAAIEKTDGTEFQGRKLVVNVPLPPGEKAPPRKTGSTNRSKLYVGNLSFYTIADTLLEAFSEFGTVHDCYLPEDPNTGASRGFGFVTMDKEDAARAVAELDGCEIDGRIVRVNEAQPKVGGGGPRLPRRQQQQDY